MRGLSRIVTELFQAGVKNENDSSPSSAAIQPRGMKFLQKASVSVHMRSTDTDQLLERLRREIRKAYFSFRAERVANIEVWFTANTDNVKRQLNG